jgi:hypothetical protein
VLDRELGVTPGPEARELRDDISTVPPRPTIEDLVAELAELTRRQTSLLQTLAAAQSTLLTPAGCCP